MTQLNSLNPLNPFIPSPFNNQIQVPGSAVAPTACLHLTQIEGFEPPRAFVDSTNTEWTLAKAATNSTVGIPDPKGVQIIDCWNHKFPRDGLSQDVYIYVIEGVKQPAVDTEQPTRVIYQWFSTLLVPTFNPQMITDKEWLKANVYSAPVVDARVSKLYALCKVPLPTKNAAVSKPSDEDPFIQMQELLNAGATTDGHKKQARG